MAVSQYQVRKFRICVLGSSDFASSTRECELLRTGGWKSGMYDTVVLGLISNNDETAYLDEVEGLTLWCQDNCLSLNVSKTKELNVDFRKRQQRKARQRLYHLRQLRKFRVSLKTFYSGAIENVLSASQCGMVIRQTRTAKLYRESCV